MEGKDKKTTKKKYWIIIAVIIVFLIAFNIFYQLAKNATRSVTTNTTTEYDEDFMEGFKSSFVPSCIDSFVKSNPDKEKAKSYCNCMLDKVLSRYTTVQEIKEMQMGNLIDEEAQQMMSECLQ